MPEEDQLTGKKMLTLYAAADLINRIDQFSAKEGYGSRAAAVRWLLEWALDHDPKPPKPPPTRPAKTKSVDENDRYRQFTLEPRINR